jgi:RHS repeat-associated protein
VSNESENTEVWFDDLNVIHQKTLVAEATDYGVWGDILREQKWIDMDAKYRYGYQGKYAEKDEETGWNHFELREYDPVIGRTYTIDPARQFHSPFMWVGNNPVSGTDPTGGVSGFDDYLMDASGNFTLIAETKEADRIYSTMSADFIQLEYDGQIADMKSGIFKGSSYDYLKFSNDDIATKFFEFAANNSTVEWAQVKYGTKSNYLATTHALDKEAGGVDLVATLLKDKYTVREHIHSHPLKNGKTIYNGPSGFHPKDQNSGDRKFAEWLNKNYPKKGVKLSVFDANLGSYIKYNHTGIINK